MSKQRVTLAVAHSDNPSGHPLPTLEYQNGLFRGEFQAMASPCQVLIDLPETEVSLAEQLTRQAAIEAWRIEFKFSRYRNDNWFADLHRHPNTWKPLDNEAQRLIAFAEQAWRASNGLFDITSGVLRQVWTFDGSDRIPEAHQVEALLSRVGWQKIGVRQEQGEQMSVSIPEGMELDFGGIGKEYAVDRVLGLMLQHAKEKECALLVNFGGDIACSGSRVNGEKWQVGIERPDSDKQAAAILTLQAGALATSGDSRRYLLKDGKRYPHVLNPITGWPVESAPRSVTVSGPTCVQSGLIATLALLHGNNARAFLEQTGLAFWVVD